MFLFDNRIDPLHADTGQDLGGAASKGQQEVDDVFTRCTDVLIACQIAAFLTLSHRIQSLLDKGSDGFDMNVVAQRLGNAFELFPTACFDDVYVVLAARCPVALALFPSDVHTNRTSQVADWYTVDCDLGDIVFCARVTVEWF